MNIWNRKGVETRGNRASRLRNPGRRTGSDRLHNTLLL